MTFLKNIKQLGLAMLVTLAVVSAYAQQGKKTSPAPTPVPVVIDAAGKIVGPLVPLAGTNALLKIDGVPVLVNLMSIITSDGSQDFVKLVPHYYANAVAFTGANCTGSAYITYGGAGYWPTTTIGDAFGAGYLYVASTSMVQSSSPPVYIQSDIQMLGRCNTRAEYRYGLVPVGKVIDLATMYTAPYHIE